MQNRFTKLKLEGFSASSIQISFVGSVDDTAYRGNEWYTVSKINKYFNTYPCILMLSTNIVIGDMDYRICGFSELKSVNKTV